MVRDRGYDEVISGLVISATKSANRISGGQGHFSGSVELVQQAVFFSRLLRTDVVRQAC